MQRWNGWGESEKDYLVSDTAKVYLAEFFGPPPKRPEDATLDQCLAQIPESRIKGAPEFIKTDAKTRLLYSRGHSLHDWLELRSGKLATVTDGVVFVECEEDIANILAYAAENEVNLIPYGGGTSVVGHINPSPTERPNVTVSMERMSHLKHLDENSQLATFEAGVRGPALEAQLNNLGYTLGHYPQSFEYSTLGGWIASRSCGQQSIKYGRIEQLFAGGRVFTPKGLLEIPTIPASAAGPSIKEIILGSEGKMGIISEATVRVRPLPEDEKIYILFFPNFTAGMNAAKEIVQSEIPISMLRLSNAKETEVNLKLSHREKLIKYAESYLNWRGLGDGKVMMMLGVTGTKKENSHNYGNIKRVIKKFKGVSFGTLMGEDWKKKRFFYPYLRNSMWEHGYAIDTLETACTWNKVPEMIEKVERAIIKALEKMNRKVIVFTHMSHFYRDGSSVYVTYLFEIGKTFEETYEAWVSLKQAASEAICDVGGTISHQHGVGIDHRKYLPREKGALGMETIETLCKEFDPNGLMNPKDLEIPSHL